MNMRGLGLRVPVIHGDPFARHEEAVRVDSVGSTCDEGGQVLTLHLVQCFSLVGEHDANVGDLVFQVASSGLDVEIIAHLHAREFIEDRGSSQARVAGEDGMGGLPTHG